MQRNDTPDLFVNHRASVVFPGMPLGKSFKPGAA